MKHFFTNTLYALTDKNCVIISKFIFFLKQFLVFMDGIYNIFVCELNKTKIQYVLA